MTKDDYIQQIYDVINSANGVLDEKEFDSLKSSVQITDLSSASEVARSIYVLYNDCKTRVSESDFQIVTDQMNELLSGK